jgi:two-component system, chemotaxis family, protein-glutamate methylesterase/glutaminase
VTHRDIIVMGASAGGVPALKTLVATLPSDLNAAVLVVLHIPVHTVSALDQILDRIGPLRARHASDEERIKSGMIYVAPTDRHLVIENQRLRLTRGPRENRVRPCIDVLFRSAALEFGSRVIGVVLTGMLDDGTAGLWAVKDRGGLAIVQNPLEAEWPSMPMSALNHVAIDHSLELREMGPTLMRLTQESLPETDERPAAEYIKLETKIAIEGNALKRGVMRMGEISPNTCPECHGVLVKIREGKIIRFRCHTGHAFSLGTLLADVNDSIDASLWNAIRAIEERALVLREMEEIARSENRTAAAKLLAKQAEEAEQRAQRIRDLVVAEDAPGLVADSGE